AAELGRLTQRILHAGRLWVSLNSLQRLDSMTSYGGILVVLDLCKSGNGILGVRTTVEQSQDCGVSHRGIPILERANQGWDGCRIGFADMPQGDDCFLARLGIRLFQLLQPMGD